MHLELDVKLCSVIDLLYEIVLQSADDEQKMESMKADLEKAEAELHEKTAELNKLREELETLRHDSEVCKVS